MIWKHNKKIKANIKLKGNEILNIVNLITEELKRRNFFQRDYNKPIDDIKYCKELLKTALKFNVKGVIYTEGENEQ